MKTSGLICACSLHLCKSGVSYKTRPALQGMHKHLIRASASGKREYISVFLQNQALLLVWMRVKKFLLMQTLDFLVLISDNEPYGSI